jgi:hypothetical protein
VTLDRRIRDLEQQRGELRDEALLAAVDRYRSSGELPKNEAHRGAVLQLVDDLAEMRHRRGLAPEER